MNYEYDLPIDDAAASANDTVIKYFPDAQPTAKYCRYDFYALRESSVLIIEFKNRSLSLAYAEENGLYLELSKYDALLEEADRLSVLTHRRATVLYLNALSDADVCFNLSTMARPEFLHARMNDMTHSEGAQVKREKAVALLFPKDALFVRKN